jgi:hypothetical protein
MSHGAAYGPGIYLTNSLNFAKSYTFGNTDFWWQGSLFGMNPSFVAVCEVINTPKKTLRVPQRLQSSIQTNIQLQPAPDAVVVAATTTTTSTTSTPPRLSQPLQNPTTRSVLSHYIYVEPQEDRVMTYV